MEDKRIYTVYMHTNKINNKKYIGITMVSPEKRWNNGNGYKKQLFYNAIKKYGWDNFEHEIVLCNLTKEEAEMLEIEMIKYYKVTDRKFGYNQDCGGNSTGGRPDYIKENISKTMKNRKINNSANNPMFGKCGELNKLSKKVICIELNKIYNSISEAARELNLQMKNISKVCYGERKTCGGYSWSFVENTSKEFLNKNTQTKNIKINNRYGEIKVICLENKITYKSIAEASLKTGANKTQISKCCRGISCTAKGLHWAYYEDWVNRKNKKTLIKNKNHHAIRKVVCVDFNKEYNSAKDASIYTNTNYQSLNNCLRGRAKTAGGYHWKYVD